MRLLSAASLAVPIAVVALAATPPASAPASVSTGASEPASSFASGGSRLVSLDGGGRVGWVRPMPDRSATPERPLRGERWHPTLPDLTIRLLGGGTFRTADQRGKVLLLDVWASWCEPCKIELPHLQRLVRAEASRGLVAIAVNAQEPADMAARGAEAFGLTLPVGLYDDTLDAALSVRSLPTVLLIDRRGRIRERWDGYSRGLESAIAARARALLAEGPEGEPETIGQVLAGGALAVRWWRELPSHVGGVAAVPRLEGGRRVIAHAASALWGFEPDGNVVGRPPAPALAGRLLPADLDGDGTPELVGWRLGRREVTVFDLASGAHATWEAPAPLLDLATLPAPGGVAQFLVLAGPEGVWTARRDGVAQPVPGTGGIVSFVTREGAATPARSAGSTSSTASSGDLWAVDATSRRPLRLVAGPQGVTRAEVAVPSGWPADAWQAVALQTGWLVVSSGMEVCLGRFSGPAALEAAVKFGQDGIAVVDARTGELRFAARLAGPVQEAKAADLDGDGVDEIVVAAGRDVVVLGAAPTA